MILTILKNLQKPVVILLLSILICSAIFITFYSLRESHLETMQSTRSSLQSAKARYNSALEQKRVYESYESRFNTLVKNGVFSDENRLNWIDAIETASKRYQIPYLKYKIEKQSTLKSNALSASFPGIDVFKSAMSLEMQLLHEGDLYRFIHGLEASAKGLFDIETCTITRNILLDKTILESRDGKNFTALCTLNWYTIGKKTFNPADTLRGRHS